MFMDKRLYKGVHGCDIHNREKLETTQTSILHRLKNCTLVSAHMDETHKCNVPWKEPHIEYMAVWLCVCLKFKRRQSEPMVIER